MKVLICWTGLSGYMSACWRQLTKQKHIQLRVLAWVPGVETHQAAFEPDIARGVDCRLLDGRERSDPAVLQEEIRTFQPDVLVVPGWANSAYCSVVADLPVSRPRVVMAMDTPWRGRLRQHFTRWHLARFLRNVDHTIVASDRTWQYARRLGFSEGQISRGVYGWDESTFGLNTGSGQNTPRMGFVFVGRLVEEKGIKTLMAAYCEYRKQTNDPWPLTLCGTGSLAHTTQQPGVKCCGFVQPAALPTILRSSSVFVLPSHYEPWGVAVAEAMGTGLPVIASEACGAAVDLVRPYWNGLLVPTKSESELTNAFLWFHKNESRIAEMRVRARISAEPFSSSNWRIRWEAVLSQVVTRKAA